MAYVMINMTYAQHLMIPSTVSRSDSWASDAHHSRGLPGFQQPNGHTVGENAGSAAQEGHRHFASAPAHPVPVGQVSIKSHF